MTKASKKEDRDSTEKGGFKIPDLMGIFPSMCVCVLIQGVFFNWYPPKSSKYKKVNLG